ncbi:MAG: class I SAM-dependent methyltransferase [Kiritimatiellae bacterium]|nr:class I SAM-dependent methyltransferase [Kiritimatiellia bacterium]
MNLKCPLCGNTRSICFQAEILKKYQVDYLYCDNCGLLQTEQPYWLKEAYNNVVANTDTGLVSRNITISKKLATMLFFLIDKDGKYADIAGGYGLLTRLMRCIGFDFYWSDLFCENIFAKGFEVSTTKRPFSAITAFEVLEHIHDPVEFIQQSLAEAETSTIIFSTDLFRNHPPESDAWRYYSLNTGQHISFFQRKSIDFLGKRLSLRAYSFGNMHMLTDKHINHYAFRIMAGRLSYLIYEYVSLRMNTRNFTDHDELAKQ